MGSTRRALGVAGLAVALLLGACSSDDPEAGGSGDPPPATELASDADDPALAEVLAEVVANPATEPGCAVAVSRDGQVVATATSGLADLEHGTPITLDSVFDIGSVSKQFTAAGIVLLADDGTVSPSDELRSVLPDLPEWGGPITLDQAMHHTSGIPDYVGPLGEGFKEADVTTADEAYLLLLALSEPDFDPGTSWSYSNSNYFLLGLAIEEATGQTLEEVLTERIFEPLGMDRTTLRDHHDEIVVGVAPAYSPNDGLGGWALAMTDWEQVGDGAIQSTVGDLLTWQAALTDGEAADFDLYESLRFDPADMGDGTTAYARGLIESEDDGVVYVGHSGTSAGYRSALEAIPDEGLAAAVLCNRSDVDADAIATAALGTQRGR
jgi:CubicO group peptidase (beta-lactamase class C family)